MMTFLDCFAGIGGFTLGLERAGMKCAGQVEIDDYCTKILARHWPQVPKWRDIREADPYGLPAVDLICGGYPCQPFSIAGQRLGAEDDRHLWPYLSRIISVLRPAWCLFENVAGHISLGLDQVLSDLEAQGYACKALVIPACAVDAPHLRERVWILAYRNRDRCEIAEDLRQWVSLAGGICGYRRTPAYEPGERWIPEPRICRVAHGVPHRAHRLRALGNAVVPQIVERIGRAIMAAQEERANYGWCQ